MNHSKDRRKWNTASSVPKEISSEQINFKMNLPAGDDRLVGAAFTLIEADKTYSREFMKRPQHVLLGAAGEAGELADGLWMMFRNQTQECPVFSRE